MHEVHLCAFMCPSARYCVYMCFSVLSMPILVVSVCGSVRTCTCVICVCGVRVSLCVRASVSTWCVRPHACGVSSRVSPPESLVMFRAP